MADELEPVNQVFTADMAQYIAEFKQAEQEAKQFASDNKLADDSLQQLVAATREQTAMLQQMRDAMIEDGAATKELKDDVNAARDAVFEFGVDTSAAAEIVGHARDEAIEAGRAFSSLRDDAVESGTAEGHLRDEAIAAGEAVGHLRDEAMTASEEVKKLGRSADETATKLDLMALSSLGTVGKLAPLLGIIGAIVVVCAGLLPAVLAAGLGIGAFGGFAIPTILQITGALKDTKAQLAQLPAPIQDVVKSIQGLEGTWKSIGKLFQPEVLTVINQALAIAGDLMKQFIPLAVQGGRALSTMLSMIKAGIDSSGFRTFIQTMTQLVVPATVAIMKLAGALLSVLGGAIDKLAPLSVPFINLLTTLVSALGGPLQAVLVNVIGLIVSLGKAISPLLPGISALATKLVNDVGSGFQSFIPIISQVIQLLGGTLLQILNDLEPILANFITPNSPFMFALKLLPNLLRAIMPMFTWLADILKHPLFAQIVVDVLSFIVVAKQVIAVLALVSKAFGLLGLAFEATPVGWIVTAIAALVFVFYELWTHCAAFREFWIGLWSDIKSIMAPVTSWIQNVIQDMTRWWDDHGKTVIAILKAAWAIISSVFKLNMDLISGVVKADLDVIEGIFKAVWNTISIATKTAWDVIYQIVNAVVKTIQLTIDMILNIIHGNWGAAWTDMKEIVSVQFNAIKNIIVAIVSGFINILYTAGRDIIQGFINGIMAMWSTVTNLIGNLGSTVSNIFSSVLSIFSPSQVFFQHGLNTMLGLVGGLRAGASGVYSTMSGIARAVAGTTIPSPASVYGAATASSTAASSYAAGGGSSGQIVVNVDGQKLFTIMQGQLYRYNIRNSGAVTGVVVPGLAA